MSNIKDYIHFTPYTYSIYHWFINELNNFCEARWLILSTFSSWQ